MYRVLLYLALSGPVMAQTPAATEPTDDLAKAQTLVNTAAQHFLSQRYEAALTALVQAEGLAVRANDPGLAGIRFNIARCFEELGRGSEALAAYEAYLKLPDESHRKARAWKAVTALEARLFGRLQIVCDPIGAQVAVAERPDAPASCPLRLERLKPATYHVTATHPGHLPAELEVRVTAGKDATLELKLVPEAPPEPAAPPPPPPAPPTNPWPWVVVGAGVVALAGGGVATVSAMDARDEAEGLAPGSERNDAVSSFELGRSLSYSAYGAGAAAVVGGVVWWLLDEPDAVTAGPTGVALRW